jgi:hypothetical protein
LFSSKGHIPFATPTKDSVIISVISIFPVDKVPSEFITGILLAIGELILFSLLFPNVSLAILFQYIPS